MIPGSNKDHPSFFKSFSYAMEGFVTAVKTERNIKVMLVAGVCTVIAGCIRHCRVGHGYHLLWPGDSRRAVQYRYGGDRRPGDPGTSSAGKARQGYRRRFRVRSFHYRRNRGPASLCPRAWLYLERDSHVRQYAAY